jgi:glycosyltransferase involved in cell wall biosynthesis
LFLDLPVKRLKYITAISEATKNEIIKYTNCAAEKIRLIENPLRENFLAETDKEFNSNCPTILQIGTAPNKNVINLVRALKDIKCRVKIIGRVDTELMNELKHNRIDFEQNFDLADAEIKDEYAKADIVAFCSTYEGFGLPVIEAQAMRTAVITSNISPLREVSGGAAMLVNPSNVSEIRKGILRLINDKIYRKNLLEKGLENAKRFEPKAIAGLYENLYQEMIKAGRYNF